MAAYPIFPEVYGLSIKKKPTFATLVPKTPKSGREVTRFQQTLPLWEFELLAEILRDPTQNIDQFTYFNGYTEFRDLIGLFVAMAGQFGWFFFEDTSDNSRSIQGLGTGDGAEVEFPFLRTITSGDLTFTEPVGGVNLDHSIVVYVDGVAVPESGNWSISSDQSTLVFDNPPADGAIIEATFYYYYLCHFIIDDLALEEFMTNRWSVKGIRFRSINRLGLTAPSWLPLTPPPLPDPPSTTPPSLDGVIAWGRIPLFPSDLTSVSLASDGHFLTTTNPNDVIVVFVANEDGGTGGTGDVLSIVSSSGLAFTRQAGGQFVIGPRSFNAEVWTARALSPLSNENITANFDIATGVAVIAAVGITGAGNVTFIDGGVNPPAFDDAPTGHPVVTITTTNQYDLIVWFSGGFGTNSNDAVPSGYTTLITNLISVTLADGPITSCVGYRQVSTVQSGVLLESAVNQAAGWCFAVAVKN